ncbi:hypothetical protein [Streptomyces sp. NPDC008139]|uniref:hypothetical protein n=1 Tax=Streptomyces sp. NPDC008139 TaxID=3364814 RepID=UPI0036E26747
MLPGGLPAGTAVTTGGDSPLLLALAAGAVAGAVPWRRSVCPPWALSRLPTPGWMWPTARGWTGRAAGGKRSSPQH